MSNCLRKTAYCVIAPFLSLNTPSGKVNVNPVVVTLELFNAETSLEIIVAAKKINFDVFVALERESDYLRPLDDTNDVEEL